VLCCTNLDEQCTFVDDYLTLLASRRHNALDERRVDGILTSHLLLRKSFFEIAIRDILEFQVAGQALLPFW
jgi:hypothetical protein